MAFGSRRLYWLTVFPCVLDPLTWLPAKPAAAPPLAGCVMVIKETPLFVMSETEMAVRLTMAGAGRVAGAL